MRTTLRAFAFVCLLAFALCAQVQTIAPTEYQNISLGKINSNFSWLAGRVVDFGTTLPASCGVGQMYIDTDGATNAYIYTCTATDTWSPFVSSATYQSGGSTVGTRPIVDLIAGTGQLIVPLDTGTKVQYTFAPDSAVFLARDQAQKNADRYVELSTADNANYTGCPADHAWIAGSLASGAKLTVKMPAAPNAAGAITFNLCSLGAVNWKQHDGTTDPGAGAMIANGLYDIFHNGTVWVNAPAPVLSVGFVDLTGSPGDNTALAAALAAKADLGDPSVTLGNIDAATNVTGHYYFTDSTTGTKPFNYGHVYITRETGGSGDGVVQLAISTATNEMAWRRYLVADGGWQAWQHVASKQNRPVTMGLLDPTTAESGFIQHKFPVPVTITKVSCSTNTGTTTIQLDERAEATPDTAGTSVLSAPLVCDTNTESTTGFANAGIAADAPLALVISATSGTPGVVRVHVYYQ